MTDAPRRGCTLIARLRIKMHLALGGRHPIKLQSGFNSDLRDVPANEGSERKKKYTREKKKERKSERKRE